MCVYNIWVCVCRCLYMCMYVCVYVYIKVYLKMTAKVEVPTSSALQCVIISSKNTMVILQVQFPIILPLETRKHTSFVHLAHPCKHMQTRTHTHTHTVAGAYKDNPATVNDSTVYLQLIFSISAVGGERTASVDRVSPERLSTAP